MRISLSGGPGAARGRAARVASASILAALGLASTATAAAVETPNACKFTYDGEYRTQGVAVTASAPAGAEPGQTVTLAGERLEVVLRQELASDAAQAGLIPSSPGGTSTTIVTRTWLAIRATNTREGTQVVGPITLPATTTAYYDEAGQSITATPFAYTPPRLPDTTWTATGGTVDFSQAGPGAIAAAKGQLPVGPGGSGATVQGSAVVQANLPNDVNFFMDCQPGTTIVTRPQAGAGTTFTALTAAPFASVAVSGPASNPVGAPPPRVQPATRPVGRILSTRLVARRKRVRLVVACPATGPDCAGTVRLRTRGAVRIGRRKAATVTLARPLRYTLAHGRRRTLTLALSVDASILLRRNATQRAVLSLVAQGRTVTRKLVLARG